MSLYRLEKFASGDGDPIDASDARNLKETIAKLQRDVAILALIEKHNMSIYKGVGGGWVAEAETEGREGRTRTIRSFYPSINQAVEALAKNLE